MQDSTPPLPFSAPTLAWFQAAFEAPTAVQRRGWEAIAGGRHCLLAAPTGSGKTLAAFLWGIDTLLGLPPRAAPGVRVLYVSPLKALVYDVERNLRAPLAGVRQTARGLGLALREPAVDVRTGDTPQDARRRQRRSPADILVTTPESLYLLLGSQARETLRGVHTVIVDEVHALAPVKRGAHLVLSLERLEELTGREPQRIGLSATVRPLEAAARFLAGAREVRVVDAGRAPDLDLRVVVPVADMARPPPPPQLPRTGPVLAPGPQEGMQERGLWPAIYPRLLEEIRAGRSTVVFVNSRGLCERLAQRLNELAGETLVLAHHGSLSHVRRAEIEDGLKRGAVRGIVATSSLELGVDMGAVDRVLLVESPGSVARGLQRVGRAGHRVGAVSVGRIYPKFRADLLECALVAQRMLAGDIESLVLPRNPLDVLAQQLVAMCCDRPRKPAELLALVRRAEPYRELSEQALERVLAMLSGHYPSTDLADLRPALSWDRAADLLSPRRGAPMLARLNAGTIPDRGSFGVYLVPEGPRVGELDEEMVYETRAGEVIALGASSWRVEEIGRDRVLVSPAPGEPGKLPFWHGDGPGRPLELGRALGALLDRLAPMDRARARDWLAKHAPLDDLAADNLAAYLEEQKQATGVLPGTRTLVVERFRDELGDWRVCLLSPLGARIHAPWAMALQRGLERRSGLEVQVLYSDDGIALRLADGEEPPRLEALLPDPDEVQELVTEQLADSALFAALFRENAARALLLTRRAAQGRRPLWAQRLQAQQLLAAVRGHGDFPVVMETYRQCLSDVFDLPGLVQVLRDVSARRVRVVEAETPFASPFARSLAFAYMAAFIYEQDAPLAERRLQALSLDRRLLAELLGAEDLRALIDPRVLVELEAELQHLAPERRARDADGLYDLLRRLGNLDEAELAVRSDTDPGPWLAALRAQRRALPVRVAGRECWIAAEDAGLYRDALGVVPPAGLPAACLAPVEAPLARLLGRFGRTHGPFLTDQAAQRFGLLPAQVQPALSLLEAQGRLVRGELRPGGSGSEWCDAEVLRRLKRRTLAGLRRQVAPVEAAALGRFLPAWQGLEAPGRGAAALERAVRGLAGLALPWSDLVRAILPARVDGFRPEDLDLLCASGAVVWVGRGALGARDGHIALYPRDTAAQLLELPATPELPAGSPEQAILAHLEHTGACFLLELQQALGRTLPGLAPAQLEEALWDLVWAGQVTNDTFAPLRQRLGGGPRRGRSVAGGRWSLVARLAGRDTSPTARLLARVWALLDRYGVVSREVVAAEDLPGGFGSLYPVLKELESAGRVRRGWFVEGLSGAQFAHPGALERLRACRGDLDAAEPGSPRWFSACDPANPYGALLPWPAAGSPKAVPRRSAGARVVLKDGRPLLYLAPGGRQLLSFAKGEALAPALALLSAMPAGSRRGSLRLERVDGVAAADSPLLPLLEQAGFVRDYRGLVLEKRFLSRGG